MELEVEGGGLVAISQSPDGQHAVTGGWGTLSIINMDRLTPKGGQMSEGSNVLAVSRAHKGRDIKDVRWHPTTPDVVASAASAPGGGNLALWNLNHLEKLEWQRKDSDRPVWRVAWTPLQGSEQMLLSASLDGTISGWDIRGKQRDQISAQVKGNPRDLRVCPLAPTMIAVGLETSDGGNIQIWDLRRPNACMERIKEETAVYAVDWHPVFPSILATGRAAKNPFPGDVKIWDLKEKTGSGDISPIGRLFTADGVSNIMWRPGYKFQLATTYVSRINRVDVWDIPQYWTPLASCCGHKGLVTDLVWQDAHIRDQNVRQNSDDCSWILSCSKDGSVQRQHLQNAYLPFQHTPNTSFSQDAEGNVVSSLCNIDRNREQLRAKTNAYKPMENGGGFLHSFPFVTTGRAVKKSEKAVTGQRRSSSHVVVGGDHYAPGVTGEMAVIRQLGLAYMVSGKTPRELCHVNQHACGRVGDQDKVAMWSLVGKLYSDMNTGRGPNVEVDRRGSIVSVQNAEPACLLPAISLSSTPDLVLPLLRKIMEHATQQGDVQTAVTLSLILGRKIVEKMEIPERELVSWIEAYLDLLHQQRLYPAASKVMMACGGQAVALDEQDALHQIAGRNQRNTSISVRFGHYLKPKPPASIPHTQYQRMSPQKPGTSPKTARHGFPHHQQFASSGRKQPGLPGAEPEKPKIECGNANCKAPTKGDSPLCANCSHSALRCGLCRVTVRGEYVWCQGCGHGGHFHHMTSWFSRYALCPTGCGHRCNMAAGGGVLG